MTERKFNIIPGEHPIVPIMIGDAALAGKMAEALLKRGVYAVGFFYPVVAAGRRVRVSQPLLRKTWSSPSREAFTAVHRNQGRKRGRVLLGPLLRFFSTVTSQDYKNA